MNSTMRIRPVFGFILLAALGAFAVQRADPVARLAASTAARAERRAAAQAWRDGSRERARQREADSRAKREGALAQQRAVRAVEPTPAIIAKPVVAPPAENDAAVMLQNARRELGALTARVGQLQDLALHLQAQVGQIGKVERLVGAPSPYPEPSASRIDVGITNGATAGDILVWGISPTGQWSVVAAPASAAVLVYDPSGDDENKVKWVSAASDLMVLQRGTNDAIQFDWVRWP